MNATSADSPISGPSTPQDAIQDMAQLTPLERAQGILDHVVMSTICDDRLILVVSIANFIRYMIEPEHTQLATRYFIELRRQSTYRYQGWPSELISLTDAILSTRWLVSKPYEEVFYAAIAIENRLIEHIDGQHIVKY